MSQPIDPQILNQANDAYKVFMGEIKSIRLDLDELLRDIVARVDHERLNDLYKKIEEIKYGNTTK
jgi:hypothetical protein